GISIALPFASCVPSGVAVATRCFDECYRTALEATPRAPSRYRTSPSRARDARPSRLLGNAERALLLVAEVEHRAVDFREPRAPGHLHRGLELAADRIDRRRDRAAAAGAERVRPRPTEQHAARAESDHPQHVEAAADAAVDEHGQSITDRVGDPRQRARGRPDAVELPPAVVRDDDPVRTDGRGLPRVLRIEDALDHER